MHMQGSDPEFLKRGPGLVAIIGVLEKYRLLFPNDNNFEYIIDELIATARGYYYDAGEKVPFEPKIETRKPVSVRAAESSDDENKIEAKPQPKKRQDDVSDGEGFGKNRGGRPTNPVLLLVSCICRHVVKPKNGFFEKPVDEKGLKATKVTTGSAKVKKEKDPDVRVRCIGSVSCKTTWATPHSQIQVFGHMKSCKWVPKTLQKQVMVLMAKDSLGDIAEALDTSESEGDRLLEEEEESINRQVDSIQFKNLVKVLHPWYKALHSSTITDNLVPTEANCVQVLQIAYLKTCRDLTISFDGRKIRRPQSVYTINVTTPDRHSFLVEGDNASHLSHTGNYNAELLEETIEEIGPGNTRSGRFKTSTRWSWILNLQDPCHKLSLAIKGICKLDEFSETRFGSVYWSAESLRRCLPAIWEIVCDTEDPVNITDSNHLFATGTPATTLLELELTKITAVLGPFVKAILCLESAHSTCADVYLFWISTLSALEDLFRSGQSGLRDDTIGQICAIANERFDQMITDGPTDIYITAFWLKLKYRSSMVFCTRGYAPTKPSTIKITGSNSIKDSDVSVAARDCLGQCLVKLLEAEYDMGDNPLLAGIEARDVIAALGPQMMAYQKGEFLFSHEVGPKETVLDWWKSIQPNSLTNIISPLAIKAYSVLPNSMAEKRTISVFTLTNTPSRNRQDVRTLIDQTMISPQYLTNDDDSGLPATLNTRSDGLSWLDGGKSDVSNASRDKFDVSRDIDLAAPILRDMLSDHAMPTVRRDAALPPKAVANGELNTKEMGPVKWQLAQRSQ
ncbi:hypothetical protein PILCRDRAFT_83731 [Piloderma croceum F 1598]|uniref:Uncharacterized protein n=1 Tax=Piloderma croceum (strain F 1598) TaxID=765440 RepID=A0A0C3BY99_PILCF|nr:hypothetical protein PILCRDRAFT_83731 [Piloderma croceum F 1598]